MTDSPLQTGISEDDRLMLGLVVEGQRDSEIALRLGWSEGRVEEAAARLSQRFGASDRLELVLLALDLIPAWTKNTEAKRKLVSRAEMEPDAGEGCG